MKNTAIRLSALGTTIGTVGALTMSGIASAMPSMSNTNQNTAPSGNTMASFMGGYQMGYSHGRPINKHRLGRLWSRLNPAKYMNAGQGSPPTLSSTAISEISSYMTQIKTNWPSTNSDPGWTPSSTNWHATWANWNPMVWERHGSSYANWSSQLTAYLTSTYPALSADLSEIGL